MAAPRPPARDAPYADVVPFRHHQPFQGGEIQLIAGPQTANTDITLTHFLKKVPRGFRFYYKTGYVDWQPGTVAWTTTTATIQLSVNLAMGKTLVGHLV